MNENYKELIGILKQERSVLERLYPLLEQEGKCLTSFDRTGLEQINDAIESLTFQMSVLEKSRHLFIDEFAQNRQVPENKATLTWMASVAPKPYSTILQGLQKQLKDTSAQLRTLQERNRGLIINGVSMVQGMMKIIEDTVNPKLTYSAHQASDKNPASIPTGRRI